MTKTALMLFDGQCIFCSRSVRFIFQRVDSEQIQFCPMQNSKGQELLSELNMPLQDFETLIVIKDNEVLIKSAAVLFIASIMPRPWSWLGQFLSIFPPQFLDSLYGLVARNRFKILGRSDRCYIPGAEQH